MLTAIAAGYVTTACRKIPTAPEQPTPVVSLTLVAGAPLHVAVITEAARADSAFPSVFPAIEPARVSLRVIDSEGTAHALTPTGDPGRFAVMVQVRGGERYRLEGTIDGETVSAETIVPRSFTILTPPGDTITTADGVASLALVTVPFTYESEGASAVEARVSATADTRGTRQIVERSEGELTFIRNNAVRDIVFFAYNSDAAEWLIRSTPRSNLNGAFGGFGAAIALQRKLWTP